ncbi:MAG: FHA domain-containing protein [Rhodospirillaceae bacterium]
MVAGSSDARSDQLLTLLREQKEMIARIAAIPELFTGPPAEALDAAALEAMAAAIDRQTARLDIGTARTLLEEQAGRLEGFFLLCRNALSEERERVNRLATEDRSSPAKLNELYEKARVAALDLVRRWGEALDCLRADANAALLASAENYIKNGRFDRGVWAAELNRRTAEAIETAKMNRPVPPALAEVLAARPTIPANLPATTPVFPYGVPALPCDDLDAARKRAEEVITPFPILARAGTEWNNQRCTLAVAALAGVIADTVMAIVGPVLADPEFKFELHLPEPTPQTVPILTDIAGSSVTSQVAVRKSREETTGALAKVGRWWKGDESEWGYQIRSTQENRVLVGLDKLILGVRKAVEAADAESGTVPFPKALEPAVEAALLIVQQRLDNLRTSLRMRVTDSLRRREALDAVRLSLDGLIKGLDGHLHRIKTAGTAPAAPEQRPAPTAGSTRAPARKVEEDDDGDATMLGDSDATMMGALVFSARGRVELCCGERKATLAGEGGKLTLGRGPDNSLVVAGAKASRSHAEILFREGSYIIVDTSTNGTVIIPNGRDPVMIKRGSEILRGSGLIGLGVDPARDSTHAILYRCISAEDG